MVTNEKIRYALKKALSDIIESMDTIVLKDDVLESINISIDIHDATDYEIPTISITKQTFPHRNVIEDIQLKTLY